MASPARRRLIVKSNPLLGRPDKFEGTKANYAKTAIFRSDDGVSGPPGGDARFQGFCPPQRDRRWRRMDTFAAFESAPMQRAVWETRAR